MLTTKNHRLGSAEIASQLRREITSGELAAKSRLQPERVLAESYGVARGTIREALNRLAEEALVEIRPGSGTYVTFNAGEATNDIMFSARPLELIDARFALEPHICRLAVLHARQKDLDNMEIQLEKMESCLDDATAFSAHDTTFHTMLAESTGNSLLVWMMTQINSVRNQEEWSRMRQVVLNRESITSYNVQHRAILNSIRAREPETSAMLMKEHLESARLSLTRSAST